MESCVLKVTIFYYLFKNDGLCDLTYECFYFSPVEYGTVGMLSEAMHLTGLQGLRDNDVVPLSQLSSVLSELYGAIRASRPVLKPGQLQQAQDMAYNWLQLAYKTWAIISLIHKHAKLNLVELCVPLGILKNTLLCSNELYMLCKFGVDIESETETLSSGAVGKK